MTIDMVCEQIESSISESINSFTMRTKYLSSTYSSVDNLIVNYWKWVRVRLKGVLFGRHPRKEIRKFVNKEKIEQPLAKLNFDGASKGNLGK